MSRLNALIPAVLAAGLMLPLAAIAAGGWFSRFASDDYCTAGVAVTRGFLEAQVIWFSTWTARFTSTALASALEELGSWTPSVLPGIAMAAWIASGMWALAPVGRRLGWPYPRLTALLLAELIPFATLIAAPDLGQSFYWLTGLVTYSLALVGGTAYAGWIVRRVSAGHAASGAVIASGAFALVLGGLSETTMTVQTGALALACVICHFTLRGHQRRAATALLLAGVVGSLIAAGVMAVAPGNYLRMRQQSDGPSLERLPISLKASFVLAFWIARRFEALSRATLLLVLAIPAIVAYLSRSRASEQSLNARNLWSGLVVAGLGFGFVALSVFPAYLVQGNDPPARIQVVSEFALVISLAAVGYVGGDVLARIVPRPSLGLVGVASLALALIPVAAAATIVGDLPYEAAYAFAWDQDDQVLRESAIQGAAVTVVAPLPPRWGWPFVDVKPDGFPNRCVAQYYGVSQVVASGPATTWSGIP